MTTAQAFLSEPLARQIGWVLVHFLWQGAALGLAATLVRWLQRRASPAWRYATLVACLSAMAACPVLTFAYLALGCEKPGPVRLVLRQHVGAATRGEAAVFPEMSGGGVAGAASPAAKSGRIRVTELMTRYAREITMAYVLGVLVMACRLVLSSHEVDRLRRLSERADEPWLTGLVARQAQRIGLKCAPLVAYCSEVAGPVLVGLLRPMILLPASAMTGLPGEQLEAVIAHEVAHIRRYDPLVNVAQMLVESVLFFHPAVWLVSRWIRTQREHCCDDAAAATLGDRVSYARSLLAVAEAAGARRRLRAAALGAGGPASRLRSRILRLVAAEEPAGARPVRAWGVGALVVAAAVALALVALGEGRQKGDEKAGAREPAPAVRVERKETDLDALLFGEQMAATLRKRVSTSFEHVPLRHAAGFLGQATGALIVAGAEAGDRTVSAALKDVSLREALDRVAGTDLAWSPLAGIIVIDTPRDILKYGVGQVRVYDVRDVLGLGEEALKAYAGESAAWRLATLLRDAAKPFLWERVVIADAKATDAGARPGVQNGAGSAMWIDAGTLCVNHVPEAHRRIGLALAGLRRKIYAGLGGGDLIGETTSVPVAGFKPRLRMVPGLREELARQDAIAKYPSREVWQEISRRGPVPWGERTTGPADKELKEALEKEVEFSFDGTPLKDVVDFLGRVVQKKITLDEQAVLEDERLVTRTLSRVPLGAALHNILPSDMGYILKDGAIYISTKQRLLLLEPREFRIYDVRDLVSDAPVPAKADGRVGGGDAAPRRTGRDLMLLVQAMTGPGPWRAVTVEDGRADEQLSALFPKVGDKPGQGREGEEVGYTMVLRRPGDLLVHASAGVHDRIEGVLTALRELADVQVVIACRFITGSGEFFDDELRKRLRPGTVLPVGEAQRLVERVKASPQAQVMQAPVITLPCGMKGACELKGKGGKNGIWLEALPFVSPDRRLVTIRAEYRLGTDRWEYKGTLAHAVSDRSTLVVLLENPDENWLLVILQPTVLAPEKPDKVPW